MNEQQQSHFEGFAILEIFGHQKYAGFVRTEYFGTACMFRCDIPPLPEREQIVRSGAYVKGVLTDSDEIRSERHTWVPPGSTVKQPATVGYSKLFGVNAVYSMTPCDEKACLAAVAEIQPRPLMLVKLPEGKALAPGMFETKNEHEDDNIECPVCHETMENCQCQ
jgi:hypothetical protein